MENNIVENPIPDAPTALEIIKELRAAIRQLKELPDQDETLPITEIDFALTGEQRKYIIDKLTEVEFSFDMTINEINSFNKEIQEVAKMRDDYQDLHIRFEGAKERIGLLNEEVHELQEMHVNHRKKIYALEEELSHIPDWVKTVVGWFR